jgi:hypothetical protein
MTQGLAILGGWAELLVLLGVLSFFIHRGAHRSAQRNDE